MIDSESPPSEGLVGGKYQLIRMIGRGGMGSVWEARHASLGTPSAIKFIEAEFADSQEARSRFDKEAKAAATIQSKHAIQIYDHGVTDDGKPYIVMELLIGEPLDKILDRGPLTLQDTARILQQVCRGLARAHERGIIHRDLKPENIFLVKTPDDDEATAKVLDFGIAKMQNPASTGLTSSTKTGAVLGTPFFMSPEQARGLRNVDHRADVWSLGVIAFKCIIGALPFDGESVGDLLVKICTSPVPVPSQVAASRGIGGVTPSFDGWFMRALEREPERRFATVTELSDALCLAAGIAPRAQTPGVGSGPITNLPTMRAQGVHHPGGGSGAMGYPQQTQGYGPTPAPGAMTNAPFTSERIAGVPSGNGKLIAGGILAGLLAICAVIGVVFFLRKPPVHPDPTTAVVAPPANVASAIPSAEKPPDRPGGESAPPPVTTTAAATASAPPATTKPPSKVSVAPIPKPPGPPKTAATPALPPIPTTTASAVTPPKKPNKNDPGY